ncbi:hypothetical protein AAHA92_10466 [Salvia divinorum]|uniref:Uncharacterized protein n=1 Tax=Salvia divinorum TaxID=28513 RepID=A0ABD1HUV2_SALDI
MKRSDIYNSSIVEAPGVALEETWVPRIVSVIQRGCRHCVMASSTNLETRYHTFKEVVGTTGTCWDRHQNFVVAADCVWAEIFKKNPFAGAYYHKDEPEFYRLATIFGLDDVKEEDAHTVIVISDSSGDGNPIPVHCATPSKDQDEVNSPAFADEPKVRRKLFLSDESSNDCESSNAKAICHLAPCRGGGLERKMKNNPPRRSQPTPPHMHSTSLLLRVHVPRVARSLPAGVLLHR